MTPQPTRTPQRWTVLRWTVALLLVANAAIHLSLTPMHLEEAPYIGVLFAALSVACLVLAVVTVVSGSRAVWMVSGAVSLAGLIAFVVSRTIGLPQIGDDIGNWSEPLGVLTMVVEVATIALAAVVLLRSSTGLAADGAAQSTAGR